MLEKNLVKTYLFSAVEDKVKTFDPRALNPSTNKQEETRSRGKTIEGMAISVVEFQNYTDLWQKMNGFKGKISIF